MSLYDLESEEESLCILRAQNKKIQDLYNEIENKDNLIMQLKSKNNLAMNSEYQNNLKYYKNKIYTLNENIKKLQNSLNENNLMIDENFHKIKDNEKHFNNQIKNKEQIIEQMKVEVQQYQEQKIIDKKQISDMTEAISFYKRENMNLHGNIKECMMRHSKYEEEIKYYCEKTQQDVQIQFDKKVMEMIELIEQQNLELSRTSKDLNKSEREKSELKNMNVKFRQEIEDLVGNLNYLRQSQSNLELIQEKMNENENFIERLQSEIDSERNKNFELKKELEIISNKNLKLTENLSEFESLKNKFQSNEDELQNLRTQFESLKVKLHNLESRFESEEKETDDFITNINNFILHLMKWADTYIRLYFNDNNKISDSSELIHSNIDIISNSLLNYCQNYIKQSNNKIKISLDKFTDLLVNIQKRNNKEFKEFEASLNEFKNENLEINKQNAILITENTDLKNITIKVDQDKLSLLEELEKLKLQIAYLKNLNEKYESEKTQSEIKNKNFYENIIEDLKNSSELTIKNVKDINKNNNLQSFNQFNNNKSMQVQLKEYIYYFLEIFKFQSNNYDAMLLKLSDFDKIKMECEEIKSEFFQYKKFYNEKLETSNKEYAENLKMEQLSKFTEKSQIEDFYKKKLEKIKANTIEKDNIIEKITQDYNLLKSQLDLTDSNFKNYKIIQKEFETELKKQCDDLLNLNKNLEKEILKYKSELEIKILEYHNLEQILHKKSNLIQELKNSLQENKVDKITNINDSNNYIIENEKLKADIKQANEINQQLKTKLDFSLNRSSYAINTTTTSDNDVIKEYEERIRLNEEELKIKDLTIKRLVNEAKQIQNYNK